MLIQDVKKASEVYERYKQKQHLNEKRESYERRKWKKRNDIYNRENKKNTIFCYETSENKRYAVHRGIHTQEYNRENYGYDREKEIPVQIEKNKIVLIYGKNNGKYQGILKLTTIMKKKENREWEIKIREIPEKFVAVEKSTLEIPEIIEIEGEKYKASDIKRIIIEKDVKIFEM